MILNELNLLYPSIICFFVLVGYFLYRIASKSLSLRDKERTEKNLKEMFDKTNEQQEKTQNIFERMFNKTTTDNKDMFNKMIDYNKSIRFTVAHEIELDYLEQTLSNLLLTLQEKGLIEKEKPQDELGQ